MATRSPLVGECPCRFVDLPCRLLPQRRGRDFVYPQQLERLVEIEHGQEDRRRVEKPLAEFVARTPAALARGARQKPPARWSSSQNKSSARISRLMICAYFMVPTGRSSGLWSTRPDAVYDPEGRRWCGAASFERSSSNGLDKGMYLCTLFPATFGCADETSHCPPRNGS